MFQHSDIEELNNNVEQWTGSTKNKLIARLDALGVKHDKNSPNKTALQKALSAQLSKKFDLVSRISFKMPRSAVFLHKGVSRGHPVSNPRTAKEWFNPVIDSELDTLADIVADGQGNMIINAISIR